MGVIFYFIFLFVCLLFFVGVFCVGFFVLFCFMGFVLPSGGTIPKQ